jgi:hypothetical protein
MRLESVHCGRGTMSLAIRSMKTKAVDDGVHETQRKWEEEARYKDDGVPIHASLSPFFSIEAFYIDSTAAGWQGETIARW